MGNRNKKKRSKIKKKNIVHLDENEFVTRKITKGTNPIKLLDQLERLFEEEKDKSKKHPYPFDNEKNEFKIPRKNEEKLKQLLKKGKKPEAMKGIVHLTGIGLREAKDYVDSLL